MVRAQQRGPDPMDDLIFCILGAGLFLGFGLYAGLLKRL
jgi:hypothetical protein